MRNKSIKKINDEMVEIKDDLFVPLLILTYLVLTYNLYRYYRFDFHANKWSMFIFMLTECFTVGSVYL